MKRSSLLSLISITTITVLFTTSLLQSGCNGEQFRRGKHFVLREGIAHFSLDYPPAYSVETFGSSPRDFDLRIARRRIGSNISDILFSILVQKPNSREPDAKASLEFHLEETESAMKYINDFKLLKRSPAVVAGIPGEQIIYSHLAYLNFDDADPSKAFLTTLVKREIFFDYNGLIWNIRISSGLEKSDEVGADFEHILQTFKLLR